MKIGIIRESKVAEYRAALLPMYVKLLVDQGHEVYFQRGLGLGVGYSDDEYCKCGAIALDSIEELFEKSVLLIKVKEPTIKECKLLKPHHILFDFLHLAAFPEQLQLLQQSGCTAIAYETLTDKSGQLPLLTPMSEIAGRLSILNSVPFLLSVNGGNGILLNGVPGVANANVVIIGAGVVGMNAIKVAVGIGAKVTVLDINAEKLRFLDNLYGNQISTLISVEHNVIEALKTADIVIGAVLIPGAKANKVITKNMLSIMKKNAIITDVAIDQGGCCETSHSTSYLEPTYRINDIIHCCIANIPSGVAQTASFALSNAILPYVKMLADNNLSMLIKNNQHIRNAVNIYQGHVVHQALAESCNQQYTDILTII